MGIRSRLHSTLTRAAARTAPAAPDPGPVAELVAKMYGTMVPPAIAAGEESQQMTPQSPFAPGTPLGPYDGFSRHPRHQDYVAGYNIATRPRLHERVSFGTLQGILNSYDIADICIWHRIDSIRSLDWQLIAADNYHGDVTDAIPVGLKALDKPDNEHSFEVWLGAWLYDVLGYDAGCLYRLRNRGGRCIGLMGVDGTTIAPLLNYWGQSPQDGAEAYVQFAQGLPFNWLTRDDLIYEPFRLHNNSPYGRAPIETVMLNANTDIRFQVYFLQRFTEGNLPAVFASAPETWGPDQIEMWQELWDGVMYGDQSRKSQVRWIPGGSSFAWTDEKEFTDTFSLFLMRKTCAAYHVVPSDIGFTENVNRSSGESQADVQHRVGDLPLIRYIEGILTHFLQDDLGLPLQFKFDRGEEQVDQVAQAQADKIYVDMGSVSSSDVRKLRYGLEEPGGRPVPRYIFTERAGPIPIASLLAVAGEIDPETAAPVPGAALPREVFGGTEGVLPNPPIKVMSLAERMYGPSAMPPAPPPQPKLQPDDTGGLVAKEGDGGDPAAGITSDAGLYGYDLEEDEDDLARAAREIAAKQAAQRPMETDGRRRPRGGQRQRSRARDLERGVMVAAAPSRVAKRYLTAGEARAAGRKARAAEMSEFLQHCDGCRDTGSWSDYPFASHSPDEARGLNQAGRVAVCKAAGQVAVAGLAVLAADTGRVLMIQRALEPGDPAGGTWEFPGGHLEDGETPLAAAWREWAEETGIMPPPGDRGPAWTSPGGVYQGITWVIEAEAMVPVRGGTLVPNPDDPDGDQVEAIAWWDPATLAGNPAVRPELAACLDDVLDALGCAGPAEGDEGTCPCGTPAVYDEANGWQHADGSVSHEDGQSVSDLMAMVVKAAYPDGQTYGSHEFRPTDGYPNVCHYCGVGVSMPYHDAYRVAKAADGRPKGEWPGWKLDLQAAAHWAPAVTAAARTALPRTRLQQLATAYAAAHPDQDGNATGKRDRTAAARAWLAGQGVTVPMGDPAQGLIADGYLIGAASAAAAVAGQGDADTGGWKPGDSSKARKRVEELGLAALLRDGGSGMAGNGDGGGGDVAGAMGDWYLTAVARVLSGWDPGIAAGELADMLEEAIADDGLAAAVNVSTLSIVSGQAALAFYLDRSVALLDWIIEDDAHVCATCLANANASPQRAGDPWPSGDQQPLVHPRCRCAIVPSSAMAPGPFPVLPGDAAQDAG
jgi:8-oxo-dGTP pyrophosphatase MutT (NUDIX family)